MKKLRAMSTILFLFIGLGLTAQNKEEQKVIAHAKEVKEKMTEKTKGLDEFFEKSAGYVIFPNVGEGAFIVGGAHGHGVVYDDNNLVGMAKLTKVDVGLQAGGQEIAEVIFFKNKEDLEKFKKGDFEFSAEASAVAIKSGKAVNASYKDGVAVFAMPKEGLMAEAAVGGQKFSYDPL